MCLHPQMHVQHVCGTSGCLRSILLAVRAQGLGLLRHSRSGRFCLYYPEDLLGLNICSAYRITTKKSSLVVHISGHISLNKLDVFILFK